MIKLAGSVCILGQGELWPGSASAGSGIGGGRCVGELLAALEDMGQEIRMARTPLPELLDRLALRCRSQAGDLLQETARRPAGGRA